MNSGSSNTQAMQLAPIQSNPVPWPIRGIGRLPVELIAQVILFSVPTDYDDPHWARLGEGKRNIERAAAPFRLARVCKHWREIALMHTPAIWSYICLPEPTTWEFADRAEAFLRILLERSKRAPLSVLLPWDAPNFQWPGEAFGSEPDSAKLIFDALIKHADRWRRVEYQAPGGGLSYPTLLRLFSRPTPLLTELHVSNLNRSMRRGGPIIYTKTVAGLLPNSPRLEVAQLGLEHFKFTTPVSSLVDLLVDSPLLHARLWDILRCTPRLKVLKLDCSYGMLGGELKHGGMELTQNPIVLPSLVLLQIRSELLTDTLQCAAAYTRMPNLTELHLPHKLIWDPEAVLDGVTSFLRANGSALTHLCFWEDRPFTSDEPLGEDYDWDAFWKIMSEQPWLAPKLEVLSLRDLVYIPGDTPEFLKFHQARMARRGAVTSFRVDWVASHEAAQRRNYYLCRRVYSLTLSENKWACLFPNAPAVTVTAKPRMKRTASSYLKPKVSYAAGISHPCYDFAASYPTLAV